MAPWPAYCGHHAICGHASAKREATCYGLFPGERIWSVNTVGMNMCLHSARAGRDCRAPQFLQDVLCTAPNVMPHWH
eukprot:9018211-Alexandrium_andersonii.AAC.1